MWHDNDGRSNGYKRSEALTIYPRLVDSQFYQPYEGALDYAEF